MIEDTSPQIALDGGTIQPAEAAQDPETTAIKLDANTSANYLLSPETIRQRAFIASYGLENTAAAKPITDFNTLLTSGYEDQARSEAASKLDTKTIGNRYNLYSQVASALPGKMTPDHMKAIDIASGYNFPFKYPTDPTSVFEQEYAKNYMSELDRFSASKGTLDFWNVSKQEAKLPANDHEAIRQYGTITMAQDQYILGKMMNIKDMIDKQSYLGYGLDFAKMAFPIFNPYYEIKARGNVAGVGFAEGGLLNENLKLQERRLKDLPYEQFTKQVDKIAEIAKDNPQAAIAVLQQLRGQTTGDEVLNALNTIGHAGDVAGVVKIGTNFFGKLALRSQLRTAVRDTIVANANPEATKQNILAGVGNLPEAAVEDGARIVENRIKGSSTVTAEGIDTLAGFYRLDKQNLQNDASLANSRKTALIQQYDVAEDSVLNAAVNVVRPDTFPLEKFSRETLRKIEQETIGRYPGMSNNIVRMSDIFIEPVSRRPYQTYWLGRNAGAAFGSVDEAADFGHFNGYRVSLTPEQMTDIDARLTAMRAELKDMPVMHEDAAGLNEYYKMEERIKMLEDKRQLLARKGGYKVLQEGDAFYIEVNKPINIHSKLIANAIVDSSRPESVSPRSWASNLPFVSYLRTAEDTMSADQRALRKASLYPQSSQMAIAHVEGEKINDLLRGRQMVDPVTGDKLPWYKRGVPLVRRFMHKEERDQFIDTLKYNQDLPSPIDGVEGHYFENYHDLADHYLRNYDTTPSAATTFAYFANSRWAINDWIWRNIAEYRSRAQFGGETHQVISVHSKTGDVVKSQEFTGMRMKEFPRTQGQILIVGESADGDSIAKNGSRIAQKNKELWDEAISKGEYVAIKLYDTSPEHRPLTGFKGGNAKIEYVVAKRVETSPLQWNQVPRRGGGHMVYDYDWYIKQAIVNSDRIDGLQHTYEGDATLHPVKIRAMGQQYADELNKVRRLLQKGDDEGAQAMFRDSHLPYEWNEFKAWFVGSTDEKGVKHPPRFNINEDFHVVPKNKSIVELNNDLATRYSKGDAFVRGGRFVDGTREGNPARAFQTEFTGQRDARGLFAVDNTGTVERPVWNVHNAEKVTPLETMNRSLGKIIRSAYMDDYKQAAMRAWIEEVKPFLSPSATMLAESSPGYFFKTASKDAFLSGPKALQPGRVEQMMANQFKINQLVGIPSKWDTFMHAIAQNLADASYLRFSKSLIPQWLLHTTEDPFAFLRSVTFNAYLGLFSIPQIFVQMASFTNIWAIAPRHSAAGTIATLMHGWTRFNKNPRIVAALDDMATKMKLPGASAWKPGEFTEAMNALDRTGFANVAGEYGPLSTMNHAKMIQSGVDRFLSWGAAPFRFGERAVRLGAWYTAFKEFREINPTKAITNSVLTQILDRADFLYGNMSSASNSTLHTGVLSLPTQFYAYNLRLAELFFSKRLAGGLGETAAERAIARTRIMAVNAGMFGVPMAFGVTGLPVGDYLRQTALDNGYKVGDKWIQSLLMEGLPSTMLALATGKYYDFGSRYGLQGFTQIRNALQSDAPFWQIVGGASASLAMNTWGNTDGIWESMKALARGDAHKFPIKMENFIDLFKEVQAVNKGYGLWVALAAGKWVNKQDQTITNVTPLNALFMTATGLNPQAKADSHNIQQNLETQKEFQKFAIKQANLYLNRASIAQSKGDTAQAGDFYTQAATRLFSADLRPDQMASVLSRAAKSSGTVIDKTAEERYVKNAPQSKRQQFQDIYGYIRKQVREGKI